MIRNYVTIACLVLSFYGFSGALECKGCIKNNECYLVGSMYEDQERCNTYQCKEKTIGMPKFYLVDTKCPYGDGMCAANGTVYTENCVKIECIAFIFNSTPKKFSHKIVEAQCMSYDDGKCIVPGSPDIFRYVIRGQLYERCQCKKHTENRVSVHCRRKQRKGGNLEV